MTQQEIAQFCIDHPYKTPAFQFYPESWFGSGHVSMMSDGERGIHACLLFSAWLEENCGIKNHDDYLISAARSKDIVSIKKVLNLSWFFYNGFWFSFKLCRERLKQVQISGFRRDAAIRKHMKNKKHTAKAVQKQCNCYANQEIEIKKEIKNVSLSFNNNITTINGIFISKDKIIPWSFYQKLVNKCCGDREQAARIIYRSKNADDPINWIMAGVKEKYAFNACADEDENPQLVRQWIDTNIYKITPEKIGDILKKI